MPRLAAGDFGGHRWLVSRRHSHATYLYRRGGKIRCRLAQVGDGPRPGKPTYMNGARQK